MHKNQCKYYEIRRPLVVRVRPPWGERVYPLPYPSPSDTFSDNRERTGKIPGFLHTSQKTTQQRGCHSHTFSRRRSHTLYKKLVFCTYVRPNIVYVILPWLRPTEFETAGNLPGFGHTLYGGEPHTLYGGSAIHCMSQAPYIVRARPRTGNPRPRSFKQGRRHEAQCAVRIV